MLTDDQILPVCYYWAKRLCDKTHSFDALVNEAYIYVKKLDSPLLLHRWIKFIMLHAKKSSVTSFKLSRRKKKDITSTLDDDELARAFNSIEDKSFNFINFMEMQDEMMEIVNSVCSEDDKRLIYARFWLNMSYEDIAAESNVVFQTIFFRIKNLLMKVRNEYKRRARELQVH